MTTDNQSDKISTYLEYLPALFAEDAFVGHFLLAFEQILSGLNQSQNEEKNLYPDQKGLEEYIDRVPNYFNPGNPPGEDPINDTDIAPKEFLPWLSNWVALSLREDWTENTKRRFISQIVPLYRQRGTKAGLKELLRLYTQEEVEIYEFDQPSHYFQVEVMLSDRKDLVQKEALARSILDREKPAHTFYTMRLIYPSIQIRDKDDAQKYTEGIWVGKNTLLGTKG